MENRIKDAMHFEEESRLTSGVSRIISPSDAAKAGAAAAAAFDGGRIIAAHGSENGAAALAYAFASGAAAAGAQCFFAGECCAPAAANAASELSCRGGCYTHTEITGSLSFFSGDGLNLYRSDEDAIERELSSSSPIPYSHFGKITTFYGADELYAAKLRTIMKTPHKGFYADLYSSSLSIIRVCGKVFEEMGDKNGERIAFRISADGRRISAYSDRTGYVFKDRLILLCAKELFEQGKDIAFCSKAPRVLEKLAEKYGRKVLSCSRAVCVNESSPSKACLEARKLAAAQMFTQDAAALAAEVSQILASKGISLAEAVEGLPVYADMSRYIPVNDAASLLERLCVPERTSDGVLSDSENGRVTVRPVRTGKGIMLSVESFAAEAAAELCDFYAEIIEKHRIP